MPNHLHVLVSFKYKEQTINTIVGNGKRFMAYEIVNNLKQCNKTTLLNLLAKNVEVQLMLKNKKHNVWELSFDWKKCDTESFILQKLNYMHNNPIKGKWQLVNDVTDYLHSSANFYITGNQGLYPIKHYLEMNDIDLSKRDV